MQPRAHTCACQTLATRANSLLSEVRYAKVVALALRPVHAIYIYNTNKI